MKKTYELDYSFALTGNNGKDAIFCIVEVVDGKKDYQRYVTVCTQIEKFWLTIYLKGTKENYFCGERRSSEQT